MFACALIFIFMLPVTFLVATIEDLFTSDELTEMGIQLGSSAL